MVSDVFYNDFQTSVARLDAMPKIIHVLSQYGLSLPPHDSKTGLIPAGDVTKLLDAVRGLDANAHRASHAAEILRLLQHAGLAV
jgi:hypothetical protein